MLLIRLQTPRNQYTRTLTDNECADIIQTRNCLRLKIEIPPTAFRTETLTLNLTYDLDPSVPVRAIVVTHTLAKGQGQRSLDSKVRVETDIPTEAIALPRVLTRSINTN